MDTLPVVDKVDKPLCPDTLNPDNPWIKELNIPVPPIPTLPVRLEKPTTLRPPFAKVKPLTVKDEPIPALPITCKGKLGDVVPIPTLPNTESPSPGNPKGAVPVHPIPVLPATDREALAPVVPIPTLPVREVTYNGGVTVDDPTWNTPVGVVLPIPTLPPFVTNNPEVALGPA